ncbi:homoserine kinase [Elusimicrobiota bacterium]
MQKKFKVRVPSTSANLGPGFDVLGVALKLYNEIEAVFFNKEILNNKNFIRILGEGENLLATNEKNIVWQAMKQTFREIYGPSWEKKFPSERFSISMKNGIPIGSGLGSSAAAYLGGILLANKIAGNKLSVYEVISLGAKLEGHPDNIVPAYFGGLCVSFSISKGIKYLQLKAPKIKAVVCTPDFKLSTEKARKVLPKNVPLSKAVFNAERLAMLISAFETKKYEYLSLAMQDKLHQPYRKHLIPGMKKVFQAALKAGAYGAALSGAGPSIIAFTKKNNSGRVSKSMRNAWKNIKISSRSFILDCDVEGAKICR